MYLPNTSVAGISLTEGKVGGLSNLSRAEAAQIDERCENCKEIMKYIHSFIYFRPDKVYMTFTMELTNLLATYIWMRKKMR